MTASRIRIVGDPVLRQRAEVVDDIDERLVRLAADMAETMYAAPGLGLAAPQVGIKQRFFVYDLGDDGGPKALINPEIVESDGEWVYDEGCLSIPGLAADVDRPTYVLLKAQDRNGKEIRIKAYDWLARIFLHEIDHLHGVLMTDKATQLYKLVKNSDGEIESVPLDQAPSLRPERFATVQHGT